MPSISGVLCVDDPSGHVTTPLHMGWMMVEILVCVHGLPVDKHIQATILSSPGEHIKDGECPIFFLLHSELMVKYVCLIYDIGKSKTNIKHSKLNVIGAFHIMVFWHRLFVFVDIAPYFGMVVFSTGVLFSFTWFLPFRRWCSNMVFFW